MKNLLSPSDRLLIYMRGCGKGLGFHRVQTARISKIIPGMVQSVIAKRKQITERV